MAVIRVELPKRAAHSHSHSHAHPHAHKPAEASHSHSDHPLHKRHYAVGKMPTYSKIFRWHPPAGHHPTVETVELVGSFTGWKKVPLVHDRVSHNWHLSVADIQSNRTHHYMLLVNGHPTSDKNCDGLAIPDGPQEAKYALAAPRGPRVLMLFAQTK